MTAWLTISGVRVRALYAPLRFPLVTASGTIPKAPLVLIDLNTTEGVTGRAYLMANNAVALRALAQLVSDLGTTLEGKALAPHDLHAKLRALFTLMGGTRGLAQTAISGLDIAMWDALAIAANQPLATFLGGGPRPLKAYDSLGMIAPKDAEAEARRSLDAGFTALKFKLGWPTLDEDLAVVRAFKASVPAATEIMVDFNQSLTVTEALRRGHALDDEGVAWIEEPVRCDDYVGAAHIAAELETPVQIGENFSGVHDMAASLHANACDLVMPDVQHIGGVTGWRQAMMLAQAAGKPMSSHLFVEASAHLLAITPSCHWLEYLDIAGAVLRETPRVLNGNVQALERAGAGIAWDEGAITRLLA